MTSKVDRSNYQVDAAIKEHRTADVTVTLLDQDHNPLTHQDVVVAQRSHKFLFGCTGFVGLLLANDMLEDAEKEQAEQCNEKLLNLCNFITLPFYWGGFEPERGQPRTQQMLNAAQWFADRGCLVKGHPLCWHSVTANWLLDMSNADIIETQVGRIRREVADFVGLVNMWDVINEVVIMPIFEQYDNGITRIAQELGRFGITRMMFDAARATNPDATLLLNDFDISTAYEILIEGCLEAGIQIDVIGVQSHMHQGYWGVEKTLEVLERFAKFSLPVHFTEITLLSGHLMPPEIVDLNDYQVDEWPTTPEGEARQTREVVECYKTLLAHPAVEAITWWGFTDGGWLNAPSGLVRKDCSVKPAYEALLDLVKGEWWLTPTKMTTDDEGKIRFKGFLGEYTLSLAGEERAFQLDEKGTAVVEIGF